MDVINRWNKQPLCASSELDLSTCLEGGQAFTWIRMDGSSWANVLDNGIVVLRECPEAGMIWVFSDRSDKEMDRLIVQIRDYFRLEFDIQQLYASWSRQDRSHFAKTANLHPGVRLLRQEPVETLFAFICSQNNGIKRITTMVQALQREYGKFVASIGNVKFYSFPSEAILSQVGIAEGLRKLGFGYRAEYIYKAACYVKENVPAGGLVSLRLEPYERVVDWLVKIPGVGPKVADCVALMALDKIEAVPIDTHIWKVAMRHYRFAQECRGKSMTRTVYTKLGEGFRSLFGERAGWAQLILFASSRSKESGPRRGRRESKP